MWGTGECSLNAKKILSALGDSRSSSLLFRDRLSPPLWILHRLMVFKLRCSQEAPDALQTPVGFSATAWSISFESFGPPVVGESGLLTPFNKLSRFPSIVKHLLPRFFLCPPLTSQRL